MLRAAPGAPVLSYLDLAFSVSPAGDLLKSLGVSDTREVDEACRAGRVYRPADLLRWLPREQVEKFMAALWYCRCVESWEGRPVDPSSEREAAGGLDTLERLRGGESVFGTPRRPVARTGPVVFVDGHPLPLTDQTARLLELALWDSGLTFDEAREEFGWGAVGSDYVRASVEKLKNAIKRGGPDFPFEVRVSSASKCVRATLRSR